MTKQFTIADMKEGYLCKRRDGLWIRWVDYRVDGYSSDLTHTDDSDRDITIVIDDEGNRLFKRGEKRMVKIGDVEVVAGVTEPPKVGQKYYFPDTAIIYKFGSSTWDTFTSDTLRLKRGLIHLTKENAIAMADAMIKAAGGEV